MWVWTGSEYKNIKSIDEAEWIKPVLHGTRCEIFVKYPDRKEPELFTGSQASGVLEYVLKRLVSSNPSEAMGRIFQQAEVEKDLSQKNGNGNHKPRKPRVLKNRELTIKKCEIAAHRRWARDRGDLDAVKEWDRKYDILISTGKVQQETPMRA